MIRSVYIIGVSDMPVKIGVADDVAKRLAELQIGCPDELVLHHAGHYPSFAAQRIEAAMHAELRRYHRRGEWFDVTAGEAGMTMERIADGVIATRAAELASRPAAPARRDEWHVFSPWAAEAVGFYRERKAARDGAADVLEMNRAMIEGGAGVAGFEVFKIQMVDGKDLGSMFYRNLGGHRRATVALQQTVNALSMWYVARREKLLLDEMQEFVA